MIQNLIKSVINPNKKRLPVYNKHNMSLYYLDNCQEHGNIIKMYLIRIVEKKFAAENNAVQMSSEEWIESCLTDAFDEWRQKGPNFAKWMNSNQRQFFDTPKMIDQLVLYNNKYFEERYNINWGHQTPDFYSETIINTYASSYARTDSFNDIYNTIIEKTRELIKEQEKKLAEEEYQMMTKNYI